MELEEANVLIGSFELSVIETKSSESWDGGYLNLIANPERRQLEGFNDGEPFF